MNRYEDLIVWQKAMLLVEKVYKLSYTLPIEEKYGLTSQLKRCSISIPSNIAEGGGRNSKKEFLHFLSIANGSTCELQTQLILLKRLEIARKEIVDELLNLSKEIQNMNYVLQKKLK